MAKVPMTVDLAKSLLNAVGHHLGAGTLATQPGTLQEQQSQQRLLWLQQQTLQQQQLQRQLQQSQAQTQHSQMSLQQSQVQQQWLQQPQQFQMPQQPQQQQPQQPQQQNEQFQVGQFQSLPTQTMFQQQQQQLQQNQVRLYSSIYNKVEDVLLDSIKAAAPSFAEKFPEGVKTTLAKAVGQMDSLACKGLDQLTANTPLLTEPTRVIVITTTAATYTMASHTTDYFASFRIAQNGLKMTNNVSLFLDKMSTKLEQPVPTDLVTGGLPVDHQGAQPDLTKSHLNAVGQQLGAGAQAAPPGTQHELQSQQQQTMKKLQVKVL
jgi:hypothetical protein